MSFVTLILLWDLWCLWSSLSGFPDRSETRETFPRTETFRSHNSRASKLSNLNQASKEIIPDSVELRETAVYFLHIQLVGTNVWLPKTHNVPQEVDFESSRSPARSESWNIPSLHCLAVFPTWQYCLYSLVWWIYEINRFRRLSQALVHFVMDRASLFTDHRISGLPKRTKYKHFRTIWEHVLNNSPTDFVSSSLKWWSSMHGADTLRSCCVVLLAKSQYRSTHFLVWHDLPYSKTTKRIDFFRAWKFFSCSCGIFGIKLGSVFVNNIFAYFTMSLSTSQENIYLRNMLVLSNRLLCWVLSTSDQDFVSSQPIWCDPHTQIRTYLFHGVRISIPIWKPSPNRAAKGFSQIVERRSSSEASTLSLQELCRFTTDFM